ncbi:zinc-finger of transposase IS204/IS1001/IS1096/IS1165, partial [Anaerocolumna aminovalerica]
MHSHCTKNLLNLEDVFIKKVVHADHYVRIFIETNPTIQTCPHCGAQTKRIHDYRYQEFKDLPFQ